MTERVNPAQVGAGSVAGDSAPRTINPLLKIAFEMGPLGVFFIGNARFDLFVATAAFMVASLVSLGALWALTRKLAIMPLVTAGIVLVFGGLTLWLQDETFIKMKPTIVNGLFAATLGIGLMLRKPLLQVVFEGAFDLTDVGWRRISLAWTLFFAFMAVLNEVLWRNMSTDAWVTFKTFGSPAITFIFAIGLTPILTRHAKEAAPAEIPEVSLKDAPADAVLGDGISRDKV